MSYAINDLIGTLGVALIIGSYFLVQTRKLPATGLAYTLANALGAFCILISLYFEFNLAAFLVELFWLLISLVGLGRIFFERRTA